MTTVDDTRTGHEFFWWSHGCKYVDPNHEESHECECGHVYEPSMHAYGADAEQARRDLLPAFIMARLAELHPDGDMGRLADEMRRTVAACVEAGATLGHAADGSPAHVARAALRGIAAIWSDHADYRRTLDDEQEG